MTFSPLAYADSLRIGSVDFVSPDEIKVLLDIEAPDNLALNTGTPRPFPRINGYVLVPGEAGYLVAQVDCDDVGALGCELDCVRAALPAGSAGDECRLARETASWAAHQPRS